MVRKPLLLILFLTVIGFADTGYKDTVQVTEVDGSPKCMAGQIKVTNGTLTCTGQTATITTGGGGGGGGSSSLAVTTGTSAGFVSVTSSPTAVIVFDSSTTRGQLTGSSTYFFSLDPSSVTLQGPAFSTQTIRSVADSQFNLTTYHALNLKTTVVPNSSTEQFFIFAEMSLQNLTGTTIDEVFFTIYRDTTASGGGLISDGTNISPNGNGIITAIQQGPVASSIPVSYFTVAVRDTPGSGSHTYTIAARTNQDTTQTWDAAILSNLVAYAIH